MDTSGEAQICFWIDGFMFCNFVVRNGKEIRSKSGKYLRFPAPFGRKGKSDDDGKGKTATSSVDV